MFEVAEVGPARLITRPIRLGRLITLSYSLLCSRSSLLWRRRLRAIRAIRGSVSCPPIHFAFCSTQPGTIF
jgi:hypothetical protein